METKTYVCPECGRKYGDLTKVQTCISTHIADTKAKEDAERARKGREIATLQAQNVKLIAQVRENCRKLRNLGVKVNVVYHENVDDTAGARTTRVTPNESTQNMKDTKDPILAFIQNLAKFEQELEKEQAEAYAKLSPQERKVADSLEAELKEIMGI